MPPSLWTCASLCLNAFSSLCLSRPTLSSSLLHPLWDAQSTLYMPLLGHTWYCIELFHCELLQVIHFLSVLPSTVLKTIRTYWISRAIPSNLVSINLPKSKLSTFTSQNLRNLRDFLVYSLIAWWANQDTYTWVITYWVPTVSFHLHDTPRTRFFY